MKFVYGTFVQDAYINQVIYTAVTEMFIELERNLTYFKLFY